MFTKVMVASMGTVLTVTLVMCYFVYEDYFAGAKVELGDEHYAEIPTAALKPYLPRWLKMPFNSIVNIGYVACGAAWCAVTSVCLIQKQMTDTQAFAFYIFNFMACCYGPMQGLRILSQLRGFAVLDQWYTLPFFMWVLVWGLLFHNGWDSARALRLMALSITSYSLVLFYEYGFEVVLGMHIALATIGGILAWRMHPKAKAMWAIIAALICCLGFVAWKLLDLYLPGIHWIFQHISGHFISKIFDIGQIHYVNKFFFTITMAANMDKKKKKE